MSEGCLVLDPNWTQIEIHRGELPKARRSDINASLRRLWPLLDAVEQETGKTPERPNLTPKLSGGRSYLVDGIGRHRGEAKQQECHRRRAVRPASDHKHPGRNQ